jgi:hypothetical protein
LIQTDAAVKAKVERLIELRRGKGRTYHEPDDKKDKTQ